jgi:4-diphosphocytidyl-2-C-methyl-D-erythritol kinase
MANRPAEGPIAVFAPAKINLALHVLGRRPDGYHDIDTLVAFATVGDRIEVRPAAELTLEIDGPFAEVLAADAQENLVLRAARRLQSGAAIPRGARLKLTKNLLVASGIGGGSADAAAALIALRQLWALPEEFDLAPIAREIGADVPMCLASEPLRATGTGDRIALLGNKAGNGSPLMPALLVNPGIEVATREVFLRLARGERPGIGRLPDEPLSAGYLGRLRNDLEEAAIAIAPEIGDALGLLRGIAGCRLARMSGSGATCFGLFDAPADIAAAARLLARDRPRWCVRTVRLGGGRSALERASKEGGSA